jgi:hypothetical protein
MNAITGIGGAGPKVAKMQLEGFGEDKLSDGTIIPAPVDMGTMGKTSRGYTRYYPRYFYQSRCIYFVYT